MPRVPLACLLAVALPGGRGAAAVGVGGDAARRRSSPRLPTAVSVVVEWISGWTDPGLRAATGAVLGFAGAGLICASLASQPEASAAALPPPLPTA